MQQCCHCIDCLVARGSFAIVEASLEDLKEQKIELNEAQHGGGSQKQSRRQRPTAAGFQLNGIKK